MCNEGERLQFLVNRDGLEHTLEFAKRGIVLYRRAVLFNKGSMYRVKFIESYLTYRRFINEHR